MSPGVTALRKKAEGKNPQRLNRTCHSNLQLALNTCRTRSSEAALQELGDECEHIKWAINGLNEGRKDDFLKSRHLFY
ncbi:hypothetical protein FKM82_003561 [Ascaphus truei]